ncbi:unnamed protein product, partial [Staurois parvus]
MSCQSAPAHIHAIAVHLHIIGVSCFSDSNPFNPLM